MFEIPSNPKIEKCVITKETVLEGKEPKVFLNNNKITKKTKSKRMSTNKKIETA